jgi:hypothetical protein
MKFEVVKIMIFLMTVWFPLHKTQELSEIFLKQSAKGLPPFIKKWQVFFGQGSPKGGKSYHLIMVEKGKVDEGYKFINKMNRPMTDIEGWNCKIEPLSGMKDAMERIKTS